MVLNREQAAVKAEAATTNVPDACQQWTRNIYGAPSAGDFDGDGAADAEDGWKVEGSHQHPGDRNPPRGVPVAYLGGSKDNGHRAISLGNGMIRSTDAGGRGKLATVPLDWPEKTWGLTYAGWSDTIDGVPIPPAPMKRPKGAPSRWAKFLHLSPYSLSDSIAGLRKGRKLGYTAADLDFHITADGIWANVHWGNLREHRIPGPGKTAALRFRNGRNVSKPVSKLPWSVVKTLRDSAGRRINTARVILAAAKRLGYTRIEVEPKDVPTVAQFERLKRHADEVGIEVVVKRLSDIPGAVECLTNAHQAGLPTMALPRGSRRLSLARYGPVTDYVRGPVRWV